jgi:hypothetical protein
VGSATGSESVTLKSERFGSFRGGIEMALFDCRWENGDFSIVQAKDKEHAIEMPDEVANAEGLP